MKILINAGNVVTGGALQVCDSVCRELYKYPQHTFTVVIGDEQNRVNHTIDDLLEANYPNIQVVRYHIPITLNTLLTGRNKVMDDIVAKNNIEAVISIFGPSYWVPKVKNHLSGFAMSQIVAEKDHPVWSMQPKKVLLKLRYFKLPYQKYLFRRSSSTFYTENSFITEKVRRMFPEKNVYTITNTINNVYDEPTRWLKDKKLPLFDGFTLLSITGNGFNKNIKIVTDTTNYLLSKYPDFKFRFVLTVNDKEFGVVTEIQKEHILLIDKVNIRQCPFLYEQCDAVLMSTLLECFSAGYAEGMKMERPIIATDLEFAHSLCGDAALYYSPLSPESLGEAIYRLANDSGLRRKLVEDGNRQILEFDTYEDRARKMIEIVENMAK